MSTDPHGSERDTIRQRLYELFDDTEAPLDTKRQRALELGREYLGVTNGHIQRRNDDGTDEVVASVGENPELLPEGAILNRETTYCRRTVESHSPLALSNAPEQGWAEDPAYREHGIDCYLGTTVFVDGAVYGTVCFTAEDARETDFTAEEKAFVELIARLLGRAIEAEAHERRIEQLSQSHRRSEAKYEALLRLAPDAIIIVDAETGAIETANERAASLTGYTETELRGMSALELHPEDDRERYARLLEKGFDERIQERFDDGTPLEIERPDGTVVPIEFGVSRVDIDDRTVMLGIIRDISERRERQRDLARQRDLFEQTQAAVGLGGWEFDLETGEGRWTDEVYRIFGFSPDNNITVEDALDRFHPTDRPRMIDAFERLTQAGESYDLELRLRTDDEVRWVRTLGRPRYDDSEEGPPNSVFGIIRDITDRKERQQDLRLKTQALEESSVGITIADANHPETPLVYANRGFEAVTGYTMGDISGQNCRFLQGEGTDEETVDEIRQAIDAEESIRTEILNYRANGTPFWNELTIAPVMDPESREVTHYVGIQKDVTARKRRDRLIEVLDRVLRHNLRNDMNVVIGFSETIANRVDGELAEMATRVKETALDLISLTDTVRGFEQGVVDSTELKQFDIRSVVESVVADLRGDYPDTEFDIEADGSPTVMATGQLELALSELGDNAARHGESTVRYEVTTTDDNRVAVRVHDSGPGLPTTERTVLEAGRETPMEHGSGLGLWMVHWIVTNLGGTVTTTVDDGTTVSIVLPPATAVDGRLTAAISDRSP
ncbi:PAS domain S-box protein [Halohasta salina]|uniref:PAS domain S-box protein n=1 Tax=Halohasta salina TaxID=2961621 RepID=UPI0020A2356E|nr:PAS domain S-box protein [Halohasta salina]